MKKIQALFGICLLPFLFKVQIVSAQATSCNGVSPKFVMTNTRDPFDPPSAVNIIDYSKTVNGIDGQENVVVFGQDPEEEGVGVSFSLESITGDIIHYENVPHCLHYGMHQDKTRAGDECRPIGADGYFYWEQVCELVRSPNVTRKIRDVKIWLEPSEATVNWLGWDVAGQEGKATLRYMYPEKWMVGTWTEDGFTTTETTDHYWTGSYYEEWLTQMQGYNFLAGDTGALSNLWSVTMVEVETPEKPGSVSLGIFGYFQLSGQTYPLPTGYSSGSQWRTDYWLLNLYTEKHRAVSDPIAREHLEPDLTSLTIKMEHLPLDLPGKWSIGVQIQMSKASMDYGGNTVTEEWDYEPDPNEDPDSHWFSQGDFSYEQDNNYFYSYVLLSTPCNPNEKDNCIDGSW
jgi:hypothetical protein